MEFSAAIFRVKNAKSNVWRIDDKKRIRRGGGRGSERAGALTFSCMMVCAEILCPCS